MNTVGQNASYAMKLAFVGIPQTLQGPKEGAEERDYTAVVAPEEKLEEQKVETQQQQAPPKTPERAGRTSLAQELTRQEIFDTYVKSEETPEQTQQTFYKVSQDTATRIDQAYKNREGLATYLLNQGAPTPEEAKQANYLRNSRKMLELEYQQYVKTDALYTRKELRDQIGALKQQEAVLVGGELKKKDETKEKGNKPAKFDQKKVSYMLRTLREIPESEYNQQSLDLVA